MRAPPRPQLAAQVPAAFQCALAEGRLDIAEYLLQALEALGTNETVDSSLADAYLMLAEPQVDGANPDDHTSASSRHS